MSFRMKLRSASGPLGLGTLPGTRTVLSIHALPGSGVGAPLPLPSLVAPLLSSVELPTTVPLADPAAYLPVVPEKGREEPIRSWLGLMFWHWKEAAALVGWWDMTLMLPQQRALSWSARPALGLMAAPEE